MYEPFLRIELYISNLFFVQFQVLNFSNLIFCFREILFFLRRISSKIVDKNSLII